MLRDAAVKTQDMLVLEEMELDVLDYDTTPPKRARDDSSSYGCDSGVNSVPQKSGLIYAEIKGGGRP